MLRMGRSLSIIFVLLQSLGISLSQKMINNPDLGHLPIISFQHPRNNSVLMWEDRMEIELAVDGFSGKAKHPDPEQGFLFHIAGSAVAKSRTGTFQVALAPGWHCLQASLSSEAPGNYQGDTVCFTLWHPSQQVSPRSSQPGRFHLTLLSSYLSCPTRS